MHPGQLALPPAVVRRLVAAQFPAWRDLPVRPVRSDGTVNALFRIGDELVARFPLRPGPPARLREELRREAEAARELLGRTAVATPAPVALGEPGPGCPVPWAVQSWLPGTVADGCGSPALARDLARFVADVRALPTRGRTFRGTGRGGDLRAHDAWVEQCCARSEDLLDVPRCRAAWAALRTLPREQPDLLTHGDLVPGNVLVDPAGSGRLVGVLDVGGLGAADPALDLVAAWHLFGQQAREEFHARLGCGELERARGRAWAFAQAIGLVRYYLESNPAMSALGRRTLERVLAAPGP
ncbi:phosphotransferase [Kineococcus sp. T13]|uniref:phosphotransferase n=1 Tax=Kineococcus vitellinus TaxID=2696565 RepID=UPI0014133C77|nr:phosphotransferase [Kineococcus vitellinus]NAZ74151.1 phosphotransferase [Kineococcus vitellinus]